MRANRPEVKTIVTTNVSAAQRRAGVNECEGPEMRLKNKKRRRVPHSTYICLKLGNLLINGYPHVVENYGSAVERTSRSHLAVVEPQGERAFPARLRAPPF